METSEKHLVIAIEYWWRQHLKANPKEGLKELRREIQRFNMTSDAVAIYNRALSGVEA